MKLEKPSVVTTLQIGKIQDRILIPEAIQFLTELHKEFNGRRKQLLQKRVERQKQLNQGILPTFLPETAAIRDDLTWNIPPPPSDLQKRAVEITGPVERKMMINALNSGANIFMADFEDALSPTWKNVIEGQSNLIDAVNRTISFISPENKSYALKDEIATLMVRPRGWHLNEKHFQIDGEEISGSLFDFGLYFFHNARRLIRQGSGPYFYLPKLENHEEARLWNDVFLFAQDFLSIPQGTIRATVLIESILAIFEAEEILYELREHSAGLNAGRWDYIFSIIKKFQKKEDPLLPDRSQITMEVPFMQAYTKRIVQICHKRDAHAIGGMAAFIPSRDNPEVTHQALEKIKEDKLRECHGGFDGTWVAHPALVAIAKGIFEEILKDQPHQIQKKFQSSEVSAHDLLDFKVPNGKITEKGVRQNVRISLLYMESWLNGVGAAALDHLMEDAATAEISRAQLWQWIHHHPAAQLPDGRTVSAELLKQFFEEEQQKIIAEAKDKNRPHLTEAKKILESIVMKKAFVEFLTLISYEHLT